MPRRSVVLEGHRTHAAPVRVRPSRLPAVSAVWLSPGMSHIPPFPCLHLTLHLSPTAARPAPGLRHHPPTLLHPPPPCSTPPHSAQRSFPKGRSRGGSPSNTVHGSPPSGNKPLSLVSRDQAQPVLPDP